MDKVNCVQICDLAGEMKFLEKLRKCSHHICQQVQTVFLDVGYNNKEAAELNEERQNRKKNKKTKKQKAKL